MLRKIAHRVRPEMQAERTEKEHLTGASAQSAPRIVIAGGGFAALESLLALRALLGDAAEISIVAPNERLAYRPAATAEAFGSQPPRAYDIAAIAAEMGASFRRDRLAAVAVEQRRVRLSSFATLPYDSLILALGARSRAAIPGALTFRDQRDVPQMRRLLREARAGAARRIVFAVPQGCAWALPLYELALLTARRAQDSGIRAEVTLVSPDRSPLEVFGQACSRLVGDMLAAQGVRFRGSAAPSHVRRDGSLALLDGGAIAADRVVAAPQLRGQRIPGVPRGRWGFVPVDEQGRVPGAEGVYAAGDMTIFPVKFGGLATQQADVIAHGIASAAGAAERAPATPTPLLQARLIGGSRLLMLQTPLDAQGRPAERSVAGWRGRPGTLGAVQWRPDEAAPEPEKVDGRYLGAFLARRQPTVA